MKQAGDFLSKFLKLTPPKDALRRALANAVSVVLEIKVEKGAVKIQNDVAFIDISSTGKHKLRMQRREVLDYLYERMPKARESVRDVR